MMTVAVTADDDDDDVVVVVCLAHVAAAPHNLMNDDDDDGCGFGTSGEPVAGDCCSKGPRLWLMNQYCFRSVVLTK